MDLTCDERFSDSPFVDRVWRSQSADAGSFISMAAIHYGMVVSKVRGRITMTVRGPETRATPAYCPDEAEFVGILFKPGTLMPRLPPVMIMDRRDVNLPRAAGHSFWLHGSAWEFPDFENADTFVDRLVRNGLLVHDPVVAAVLRGQPAGASLRTVQRRFLRATGLTHAAIDQIERARQATALLKQGVSIFDTIDRVGYYDQPHLTRSLKRYVGLTPAQIMDRSRSERLSFLYKPAPSG